MKFFNKRTFLFSLLWESFVPSHRTSERIKVMQPFRETSFTEWVTDLQECDCVIIVWKRENKFYIFVFKTHTPLRFSIWFILSLPLSFFDIWNCHPCFRSLVDLIYYLFVIRKKGTDILVTNSFSGMTCNMKEQCLQFYNSITRFFWRSITDNLAPLSLSWQWCHRFLCFDFKTHKWPQPIASSNHGFSHWWLITMCNVTDSIIL